jgi:GNAT superfamily N-acetyltransferase
MYWHITRARFEKQKGGGNKRAMKRIVSRGRVPGLIAYSQDEPVAWCALEPRENYSVLERSRILKPVDDQPVWSVVCFFVSKSHRGRGLSVELLQAATRYARKRGANIVEGYPVEPKKTPMPAAFAWTGLANAFRKAGFKEVARRSPTRPIMRWATW